MRIKDKVRAVMERLGLDPSGLASKLGVTANTVYRYLNGSVYPSPDVLIRLCEIGGLDLAEMLAQLTKERRASRHKSYASERGDWSSFAGEGSAALRKEARPLLELLDKLNDEQLNAIRQCAEALVAGDPELERHLIAQLKFLTRMVSSQSLKRNSRSR